MTRLICDGGRIYICCEDFSCVVAGYLLSCHCSRATAADQRACHWSGPTGLQRHEDMTWMRTCPSLLLSTFLATATLSARAASQRADHALALSPDLLRPRALSRLRSLAQWIGRNSGKPRLPAASDDFAKCDACRQGCLYAVKPIACKHHHGHSCS